MYSILNAAERGNIRQKNATFSKENKTAIIRSTENCVLFSRKHKTNIILLHYLLGRCIHYRVYIIHFYNPNNTISLIFLATTEFGSCMKFNYVY